MKIDVASGQARHGDIAQITQLLMRHAQAVDRRDWASVRDAYHDDAHDNHGSYNGPVDGFIQSLQLRHALIEQSLHVVTNVVVDFVDEHCALVESYFNASQRLSPAMGTARLTHLSRDEVVGDDDAVDTDILGRYLDLVTRLEGRWRILRRDVLFDRYRACVVRAPARGNPMLQCSRRDEQDLLLRRRRALGL